MARASVQRLQNRIAREARMRGHENFVRGGSQTTPIAEDIKGLTQGESELGFLSEVIQSGGNVRGPALRLLAGAWDRIHRPGIYNPEVNRELATRLFQPATTGNVKALRRELAALRARGIVLDAPAERDLIRAALFVQREQQGGNEQQPSRGSLGERPIDLSRPILQNNDGTFSTEQTITIGADGRFFNIPTIVNGQRVGEEQAIALWRAGRNEAVGEFLTEEEALASARSRTERIGRVRAPLEERAAAYSDDELERIAGGAN